jgi:RNA polymerase-binding transcription factor DksA
MAKRKQARSGRKPKASTRDVVGQPATAVRVASKWRKHYKRLVELRGHLLNRQADLTKDALEEQPSFSSHMADAGTDTYDRDFALGMLSSEQDAASEIDYALNRILNGTYGICELTGKPIERARLEAIPWARFSTAAEKKLESEGALKRASLGPRESLIRESFIQAADDES